MGKNAATRTFQALRLLVNQELEELAFVLSQAGLLVTKDAPRDMPDRGRMKILWACPSERNGEVVHIELPRVR